MRPFPLVMSVLTTILAASRMATDRPEEAFLCALLAVWWALEARS